MTMLRTATRLITLFCMALLALASLALAAEQNLGSGGIAIQGYDPVAYFIDNKAVPGSPDITLTHDGATYRFASDEHRAAFEANPGQYVPQYGGYCAYGAAQGYKASVEPDQFTIADGKLYLNYNASVRARWNEDQANYINKADAYWSTQ
ncbi:hypothetical protein SAMN05877838_0986 [Hoeflea halophila]|uniref:YHS domain-containing protein n=1 Tax=Hoeflea halophila TaxID=714899 RepID=A0A286I3P8_9HYPH|nr:YHS domain-containing (seleno)protein [Hoeflea halophila]SOE14326.1 hypothetical protein SAMN05877838_0986 [Hoeflea halophila]